jgi:hypothetical protein
MSCRGAAKAPLLKLFEFLTASLCLFLINDADPQAPRRDDVFAHASMGRGKAGWWSVDLARPPPSLPDSPTHLRAYELLCICLTLEIPDAWKIVQLALLSLWHVCLQDAGAERLIVEQGLASAVLDIAGATQWPAVLRQMATGFVSNLWECSHHVPHLGGLATTMGIHVKLLRSNVCVRLTLCLALLSRSSVHSLCHATLKQCHPWKSIGTSGSRQQ